MAFGKKDDGVAVVHAANIVRATFRIVGTAPYVQAKFSKKAKDKMLADMATPKSAKMRSH